jgi:hypothetical protein
MYYHGNHIEKKILQFEDLWLLCRFFNIFSKNGEFPWWDVVPRKNTIWEYAISPKQLGSKSKNVILINSQTLKKELFSSKKNGCM